MRFFLRRVGPLVALLGVLFGGLPTAARSGPGADIPHVSAFNTLRQRVPVREYAGRAFRFSVQLRVDTTASGGALMNLFATGFDAGKRYLFGTNHNPANEVRSNQWQTYTAEGVLPKKVDFLMLSVLFGLNGTFGIDNARLEVAQGKGQWQQVRLRNADFEEADRDSLTHLPVGWEWGARVPQFSYQQVAELPVAVSSPAAQPAAPAGNHYLEIRGRGIVNYGKNRPAHHYQPLASGPTLYYETYGQGEPLLLLHGNGESIASFREQIGALATHYRVIAVDTRGHGQSTTTPQRYTYDLFAADMIELLDSLRVPAAHVVGWSDGGNTGLSMALHYPRRVASLVTMGANLYPNHGAVERKTIREVRLIHTASLVLQPFGPQWRRARRLSALLLRYPRMAPAELQAVAAPTLVLAGEKDVIVEAHTRLIAGSIPGAQCVILPGLTHYAPQENAPLFNQTVLAFLRQHPLALRP